MARPAIHPGEQLAEELKALGMSAAELARQMQVPTNRITGILNGQRALTGDTVLRLGHFFSTSPGILARPPEPLRAPVGRGESRQGHQEFAQNNRIVERLRFLSQMRAHARMLQFRIGDRVSFQADGDRRIIGILTRYNRKTVTVVTNDGRRWNVSPTLLRGGDGDRASEDQAPNIIPLRRK